MKVFVVLALLAAVAAAQDPAGSWLSYTEYDAPGTITFMSANWTVPSNPKDPFGGNAPGYWWGIENSQGSQQLIQPILAWADGLPRWTIFNGVFSWGGPQQGWHQSRSIEVHPGDKISSYVRYDSSTQNYVMNIAAKGESVTTEFPAQGFVYDRAWFVLEHQGACGGYSSDGKVSFTDIIIEVEGKTVTPAWQAKQEQPVCGSEAHVISPSEVTITWNP